MDFTIKSINGQEQAKQFREELQKEYQEKLKQIVEQIRGSDTMQIKSPKFLVKRLFDWWNKNIKYDNDILKNKRAEGNYSEILYDYKNVALRSGEKYAPIILRKGVCSGFSAAFKDLCDLLGIECRIVNAHDDDVNISSFKKLAHAWNEITIDGETTTIDLDPHFLTFMGARRTKPKFEIHP